MSEIQIRKILVPIDGSEASLKAARYAIKIAKQEKAKLLCIHALGTPVYITEYRSPLLLPSYYEAGKKLSEEWFTKVREIASKEAVNVNTELIMEVVSVIDAIVSYASEKDVDLIVIGTRGRTGVKRFLLGSIADGVVSHAHCPVLVVR
jgi:nucleotide-binding universal stress UspA family protein